jgi:hypothetical protein
MIIYETDIGSATGTQSQYMKDSWGTLTTTYSKMAVIVAMNIVTKEYFFRVSSTKHTHTQAFII